MIAATKKTRRMSDKTFLNLAAKNVNSAAGFLAGHRNWLETGELSSKLSPILNKIDQQEVLPVHGLQAITNIVTMHMLAVSNAKAEASLTSSPKEEKPYFAQILDAKNKIVVVLDENKEEKELRASFDHAQEAEHWCQRRLNEGSPSWRGEVIWKLVITKEGKPFVSHVTRAESISALIPQKKSPFMHYNKVSAGAHKPGSEKMRVSAYSAKFSHG